MKARTMNEGETKEVLPAPDHNHAHGTGVRWLDVVVTVSVVFLSILSLVVSIEHGKTMEKMVDQNQKMVEASTLPLLTNMGSNLDPVTKKLSPREALFNDGVGPAIIDEFEVRYKGVVYSREDLLLKACCVPPDLMVRNKSVLRRDVFYSNVSGAILSARGSIAFLTLGPQADPQMIKALEMARESDDLSYHACYCSVLDECWETNFDHKRPQPVKECRVGPDEKLW